MSAVEIFRPGDVLGGAWKIDELLRRGSSGTVYAATDLRLGRKVAVKALTGVVLDPEVVARLEREAKVLARIDHPNVVALHTIDRHQNIPYLVMQFVEGVSLSQRVLEKGGLEPKEVLSVAQQIGSALAALHKEGLLHRDVKPSNLIVSKQGHVTLIDFGITRPQSSALTRTGVVHGTPGYMSPEAILGEKRLDGRADQYALAAVIFELLTGSVPFAPLAGEALLRAHLTQPRPKAHLVRATLPPLVSVVLARGMAVEPDGRYERVEDFVEALRAAFATSVASAASAEVSDAVTAPRNALVDGPTDPSREALPRPDAEGVDATRPMQSFAAPGPGGLAGATRPVPPPARPPPPGVADPSNAADGATRPMPANAGAGAQPGAAGAAPQAPRRTLSNPGVPASSAKPALADAPPRPSSPGIRSPAAGGPRPSSPNVPAAGNAAPRPSSPNVPAVGNAAPRPSSPNVPAVGNAAPRASSPNVPAVGNAAPRASSPGVPSVGGAQPGTGAPRRSNPNAPALARAPGATQPPPSSPVGPLPEVLPTPTGLTPLKRDDHPNKPPSFVERHPRLFWGSLVGVALILGVAAIFWPTGEKAGPAPAQPLPITVVGVIPPPPPPDPVANTRTSATAQDMKEALPPIPAVPPKPRPQIRKGASVSPQRLREKRVGSLRSMQLSEALIIATFNDKPVGALVEVDGVVKGITPLPLTMPPGEHRLRLDYGGAPVTEFGTIFLPGKATRVEVELPSAKEVKERDARNRAIVRAHGEYD